MVSAYHHLLEQRLDGAVTTEGGPLKDFHRATGDTLTHVKMLQGPCLVFFKASSVTLATFLLCSAEGFLMKDQHQGGDGGGGRSKSILEMLHINKVSASHQVEPHPYMKQIYHKSHFLEVQDLVGNPDGTLIQSYRSVGGEAAPPLVTASLLPLFK